MKINRAPKGPLAALSEMRVVRQDSKVAYSLCSSLLTSSFVGVPEHIAAAGTIFN